MNKKDFYNLDDTDRKEDIHRLLDKIQRPNDDSLSSHNNSPLDMHSYDLKNATLNSFNSTGPKDRKSHTPRSANADRTYVYDKTANTSELITNFDGYDKSKRSSTSGMRHMDDDRKHADEDDEELKSSSKPFFNSQRFAKNTNKTLTMNELSRHEDDESDASSHSPFNRHRKRGKSLKSSMGRKKGFPNTNAPTMDLITGIESPPTNFKNMECEESLSLTPSPQSDNGSFFPNSQFPKFLHLLGLLRIA